MPNLRDIKLRIKSVQKTQKLTNAMKMVAAARLRRADLQLRNSRRMFDKLEDIYRRVDFSDLAPDELPLVQGRGNVRDIALIVIAGERGLCGAFNNNIIQHAARLHDQGSNIKLICLGKKALTFFTRHNFPMLFGRPEITENMSFTQACDLAQEVIHLYTDGVVDEVQLLYHRFHSMILQRITHETLIPNTPRQEPENIEKTAEKTSESEVEERSEGADTAPKLQQMLYEPSPAFLLERLTPFMITSQLFRAVTESAASELAARRLAMENATDNADELIKTLSLSYNRTRQSVITNEIIEVVVGGESLK